MKNKSIYVNVSEVCSAWKSHSVKDVSIYIMHFEGTLFLTEVTVLKM